MASAARRPLLPSGRTAQASRHGNRAKTVLCSAAEVAAFGGFTMTRLVPLSVFALLLGSSSGIAADAFVGKWVTTDEKTGRLTRLEIGKTDKGWTIQAWGAAE